MERDKKIATLISGGIGLGYTHCVGSGPGLRPICILC
jgi:hypothetical protein